MSDQIVEAQVPSKTNRRKDEIQEATINAGIDLLRDLGISEGLAPVKFEDAITRSGVARATAYRAWSSDSGRRPQARFQEAVALRLLDPDRRVSAQEAMMTAIGPMLVDIERPSFATLSPRERGQLLKEIARVACNASYFAYCNEPILKLQLGFSALVRMHGELDPEDPMVQALNAGGNILVERFTPIFTGIMESFGLKIRNGHTLEQLTHATLSYLEGLWFRPLLVHSNSLSADNDESSSLFAHGVWAFVQYFMVDDPHSEPQTDLSV